MSKIVRCPLVPDHLHVSDINVGNLMFDGMKSHSATALIDVMSGVTVSRRELLQKGEAVAANLVSRGCRGGDVVAIFAHNSLEWVVMLAAALRVDAVPATINALLTADELVDQLKVCRPKVLYVARALLGIAIEANKELERPLALIITDGDHKGCVNLDSLLVKPSDSSMASSFESPQRKTGRDTALILFSSGTTGPQKAVELSHHSVVLQIVTATHPVTKYLFDNVIGFAPFSHVIGCITVLAAIAVGYTVHIMTKFDFRTLIRLMQDHKTEGIMLVPPIATLMAKSPVVDEYKLESLKVICCGAAPLGSDVELLLRNRFPGLQVRQLMGMTELSGGFIGVPVDCSSVNKPGSSGVPLFNTDVKVIDSITGEVLGANQSGEICVKSPRVMSGYLNNPKATSETIDPDGWLHTGDLGYHDDDGYFFITDRIKELIKYNAYQVAPAELESVLLSHPAVADAAVVGVPDPTAGELPFACVVLKPSANASSEDILTFVAGRVAPYKRLRGGLKFVSAIPKSASGKILRKDIKSGFLKGNL